MRRPLPALLLGVLLAARAVDAQAPPAASREAALEAIAPSVIAGHVQLLSHDLLEGRDTGTRGYEIAREYVASQYRRIGLRPIDGASYLQPFDVLAGGEDAGSLLRVGGTDLTAREASFAPDWTGLQPAIEGEGVYLGYGLAGEGRDDYAGADVRDRIVFLLAGVPADWADHPVKSRQARTKVGEALRRGARAVVVLSTTGPELPAASRPMALAGGTSPTPRPAVTVARAGTATLLTSWRIDPAQAETLAARGAPPLPTGATRIARARPVTTIRSWNVVGTVPGTDPARREEAIVFVAHLDHVGVGEADERGDRIFNGTHDNALGIAKMLGAAEALARAAAARTVVFVAVGAEERGLLGAWHYVNHPVVPLARTALALNHDGGLEGAATDDFFAFGLEFTSMGPLFERAAAAMGMRVATEFPPPFSPSQALLFRSDHFAFLAAGVPAVYLMDGFTIGGDPERGRRQWDTYLREVNHRQRDNFDPSWTFESAVRMARLSVRLAWLAGDSPAMPSMVDSPLFPATRAGPPRRDAPASTRP